MTELKTFRVSKPSWVAALQITHCGDEVVWSTTAGTTPSKRRRSTTSGQQDLTSCPVNFAPSESPASSSRTKTH